MVWAALIPTFIIIVKVVIESEFSLLSSKFSIRIHDILNKVIYAIKLKRNEAIKSLNSVIQCLFHIEPFVNYIKSKFYEINKRDIYNKFKANGKCLTDPLKNLLDELFPEKFEKTEDYEMKTKSESISTEDLSKIIYAIN